MTLKLVLLAITSVVVAVIIAGYIISQRRADAYPLVIQRAVSVTELDEGYKVECRQDRNPYPYAEYAKDSLDAAFEKAKLCITKRSMAIPEDRKRRKK